MDIVGAIRSAPLVDVAIFAGLVAWFSLGVVQGSIRRILGIISTVFSFLLAANLRGFVGDYLADHWHQFPLGYNHLLATMMGKASTRERISTPPSPSWTTSSAGCWVCSRASSC